MNTSKLNSRKLIVLLTGGGGVILASMLNLVPVQASTLSQSSSVTVTGGHYYTYTYYQEVQTGSQQVQTGTTTETVVSGSGTCEETTTSTGSCPTGASTTLTSIGGFYCDSNNAAQSPWGIYAQYTSSWTCFPANELVTAEDYTTYTTETIPVYTTEPAYTNEQFTGTAWSPATITYS